MKRLIKASNALSQMREAQRQLALLPKDKVDYVQKCYNDVLSEYSKVDPEHPYPSYMYDDIADFLDNLAHYYYNRYWDQDIMFFNREESDTSLEANEEWDVDEHRVAFITLRPDELSKWYPNAIMMNPEATNSDPYTLVKAAVRMRVDGIGIDDIFYNDEVDTLNESAIKTDWLIGAIEDDLMTEEEFNHIYELIEKASLEDAIAQS